MRFLPVAALACQISLSGCATVVAVAAAHPVAIAAVAEILPIVAVMGGIGLIGLAGVAGEQPETYAPGTLGAVFAERQLASRTSTNAAMTEQREAAVAAGLQVERSIARARIAFREQLGAKVEAVDSAAKASLAEIDAGIEASSRAGPSAAKAAEERIRLAADRLAVPAQMPQIRSYGPYYLFPFLPFQTFTVRGDFPAAYPGGVVPQLAINGRAYNAFTYDAQSIGFSLPVSLFTPAPQGIAWVRAELSIPWDAPRFDTFARQGLGNFVVIGVLPDAPGRVAIEHRIEGVRVEEATRTSDAFTLSAQAGESEQTACVTLMPAELAAGWKLRPGSASAAITAQSAGTWKDHGRVSEDERSACWRLELDSAERLAWRLSAVMRREVREIRTESEVFDLAWGGTRVFNYPAGSWTVRYAKYGGAEVVFTGTDLSSPLFRVEGNARSVKVSAYPF